MTRIFVELDLCKEVSMPIQIPTSYNSRMNLSTQSIKAWGIKGGLGIFDQGVFSGANFLASIFLARQLSSEDFGAFAMGFAVITFFMQIYTSFTLEPMGILGPYSYRNLLNEYFSAHVRLLFLLSIPAVIFLSIIVWLNQLINNNTPTTFIMFLSALSLPFILFPLLMRRVYYVLQKPGWSLLGSLIYFLALILLFLGTIYIDKLSGEISVIVFSLASFISGLILLMKLRKGNPSSHGIRVYDLFINTWSFGKWLLVSGALIGLATQSQIYLVGTLSSIHEAAEVRILQTFIQPMMLTITALSALAAPRITATFSLGAYRSMRNKVVQFTVALGGIALGYELLLLIFGTSLNDILFTDKYQSLASQIPIWGLSPILLAFSWGGAISLQAAQKPQAILIIASFWAFFSFITALLLIPTWGSWGATVSFSIGFISVFISTWILYWLWVDRVYIYKKD